MEDGVGAGSRRHAVCGPERLYRALIEADHVAGRFHVALQRRSQRIGNNQHNATMVSSTGY